MNDELDVIDAPMCPNCMHRCEAAGTTEHPFWWCPSCKVAVLPKR